MEKLSKTVTTDTDQREVFLSYALADGKIARKLCDKLESAGISVWYATRDIMPGDNFLQSVNNAFQQCSVFVCILSEVSMKSSYVLDELGAAFRRARRHDDICILPVLVDTENLSDELLYYLNRMQFLDARNQPLETVLDGVVKRVQDIISATWGEHDTREAMNERAKYK